MASASGARILRAFQQDDQSNWLCLECSRLPPTCVDMYTRGLVCTPCAEALSRMPNHLVKDMLQVTVAEARAVRSTGGNQAINRYWMANFTYPSLELPIGLAHFLYLKYESALWVIKTADEMEEGGGAYEMPPEVLWTAIMHRVARAMEDVDVRRADVMRLQSSFPTESMIASWSYRERPALLADFDKKRSALNEELMRIQLKVDAIDCENDYEKSFRRAHVHALDELFEVLTGVKNKLDAARARHHH